MQQIDAVKAIDERMEGLRALFAKGPEALAAAAERIPDSDSRELIRNAATEQQKVFELLFTELKNNFLIQWNLVQRLTQAEALIAVLQAQLPKPQIN